MTPTGVSQGIEAAVKFAFGLSATYICFNHWLNTYHEEAVDGVATVNGAANLKTVKLGTSSKVGDVTITVPAGTKKLVFNAVAWKGATAVATLKVGDSEIGKIENIAGNDGATGNAPYTITVENDTYTFSYDFKSETSVNVSTDKRVVIYGLKAE